MIPQPHEIPSHAPRFSELAPHQVAVIVREHLESGRDAHALAYLAHSTRILSTADPADLHLLDIHQEPVSMPNPVWDVFFKALYRRAIPGRKPAWTETAALPEPTYIIARESNHLRADLGTPSWLRELNILIDEENLRLF